MYCLFQEILSWNKYFAHKENNINIIEFRLVFELFFYFILLVILVLYLIQGFKWEINDLLIGLFGGVINLITSLLNSYVITRGYAGPGEALICSWNSVQIVLEMIFFQRIPNLLQSFGIVFAFIGAGWIIIGHKLTK